MGVIGPNALAMFGPPKVSATIFTMAETSKILQWFRYLKSSV